MAAATHPLAAPTTPQRLEVALLLTGTALLYLWRITVNAMANPFYAGAAWAGSRNWEALLFGSVDPSNFITVDKPPVSQWIMALSGRLFGFSSASMLVPQAVLGVASVWFVYATASRVAGRAAGLLGGAAFALTPVAAMMFRYNNPDAAMVFFMVLGAWATVRAAERASGRWLALAGAFMGVAFLAKMLEGLMSLPALVVLYLLAAPAPWRRKLWHLLGAAAALVASSGWYVLLTILWPAAQRPYLAGSTDNSFLNLVFGYNGLARVQGRSGSSSAHSGASSHATAAAGQTGAAMDAARARFGSGGFGGMGGPAGPSRLFTGEFGLEISWLIPAALVGLVAVLVLARRRPRTDLLRATALMAGLWMVADGAVLSFMNGTTHAYYTLAIAPAIAWCFALGAALAWQERSRLVARVLLALLVLAGGGWGAWLLLGVAPGWHPWIGWTVAVVSVLGALALLVGPLRGAGMHRLALTAVTGALLACLGAPAAIAVNSVGVSHTGGSPSVMPSGVHTANRGLSAAGSGRRGTARTSGSWAGAAAAGTSGHAGSRGGEGAMQVPAALVQELQGSRATWAAAVLTTSAASQLELAARVPVMGIGGFTGQDPTPTLAQFQADVKAGRITDFVVLGSASGRGGGWFGAGATGTGGVGAGTAGSAHAGGVSGQWSGMAGGGRSSGVGSQILAWVKAHYSARQVGTTTVYRLS